MTLTCFAWYVEEEALRQRETRLLSARRAHHSWVPMRATAVRPQSREHRIAVCAGKVARRTCDDCLRGRPIFSDVATNRQIALGLSVFQIKLTCLGGRIIRHGCSRSNAVLLYRRCRATVRVGLYCAAVFKPIRIYHIGDCAATDCPGAGMHGIWCAFAIMAQVFHSCLHSLVFAVCQFLNRHWSM